VVAVDDDGQAVELELGGGARGLPDLAFTELAVAGEDVRMIILTVNAGGQRMASTPASRVMFGCPSSGLPSFLRVMISSLGK